MIIVGVDGASIKTGLSAFEDGKLKKYTLINLAKKSNEARIDLMAEMIYNFIKQNNADVVYYEDNWSGVNPKINKMLATILGEVRGYCYSHGIKFVSILPSAWRKVLGLAAKKREQAKYKSIEFVRQNFEIKVNDDVADAICIGLTGYLKEKQS